MIIKKNLPIKIIVFTVILDSIGIGIMIPVLPNLMTDVLPGRTVAEAAVWGGILASIFAIMQFIFGLTPAQPAARSSQPQPQTPSHISSHTWVKCNHCSNRTFE